MKKLNLLKPDLHKVYLNNGKGERVKYLQVNTEFNLDTLESDVKAGAVQFKDCLEVAKKKPSKLVVVECSNEEEGLMAVTYLAAVYNEKEDKQSELGNEDTPWNCNSEEQELEVSDFEENIWDSDSFFDDDVDEFEDESGGWLEDPNRIPVINVSEIAEANRIQSNIFFPEHQNMIGGIMNHPPKLPYWMSVKKEPICIIYDKNAHFFGSIDSLDENIERFLENRHVFLIYVRDEFSYDYEREEENDYVNEEELPFFSEDSYMKDQISELVLSRTAKLVGVKTDKDSLLKYQTILFENWATEFGVSLANGFPKKEVTEQVVALKNPNKSEIIEKVYRYVIEQYEVGKILKKEDFSVLKKFRRLGYGSKKKNDNQIYTKMQNSLVGLQDVKEQVDNIINVMKYNKKRKELGLGVGDFHNVHLMIGAPGTAKTTMARYMGNIMAEQKLLPGNRFIAINGAELKGLYVGHSAPKTKAYFDNYDIIFIDEAYSLTSEREVDSFSQEALAQLMIELEKHGMDKLVIFAGYGGTDVEEKDNKMLQFLNANPGIRSRINSTIYFKSYSPDEMLDIVHCLAKNNKFILDKNADEKIKAYFNTRYRDSDFGNGREARSFLENVMMEAATRTAKLEPKKQTKKALQQLTMDDIEVAISRMEQAIKKQNGKKRTEFGYVL
jgi:AAA+ superfamily predicted ATPase